MAEYEFLSDIRVSGEGTFTGEVSATRFRGIADSADELETARDIEVVITGAVEGTASAAFDGSDDISISVTTIGDPALDGKGWTGTTILTPGDEYKIKFDSTDGLEFTTDNLIGPKGDSGGLLVTNITWDSLVNLADKFAGDLFNITTPNPYDGLTYGRVILASSSRFEWEDSYKLIRLITIE